MKPRKASWHQNFARAAKHLRTSPDGILHDSVEEKERWCKLLMDQKLGLLRGLRRQVIFELRIDDRRAVLTPTGKVARYTADFVYSRPARDPDGLPIWVEIIEDHKGYLDDNSKFRIAVVEAIYGIKVSIHTNGNPLKIGKKKKRTPKETSRKLADIPLFE